jgi:hypothetical protein
MDMKTQCLIDAIVKNDIRGAVNDDGLDETLSFKFDDYDFRDSVFDLVSPLMKDKEDDDEFDELMNQLTGYAQERFNSIMMKLHDARTIIEDALT